MQDLKHVGKSKTTGKKVLVAYRTLPGDAYNCLVIPTENLSDANHDALIQLVESPAAQNSFEFADVLARAKFPDGSTMLPALHGQGRLIKVGTDQITMTPNFTTTLDLSELNQMIADQRGVAVGDLAVKEATPTGKTEVVEVASVKDISPSAKTTSESVTEDIQLAVENLSSDDKAKKFRSEADRLSKQAAALRRQAEELAPTKKAK